MLGYVRTIGLIFIFGPLSAMLVEPFFENLFDKLGWDSEKLAGPVMTLINENTSWLVLVFGIGVGIWVHYLAGLLTKRKTGSTGKGQNAIRLAIGVDTATGAFNTIENIGVARYYIDPTMSGEWGLLFIAFRLDTGTDRLVVTSLNGAAIATRLLDRSARTLVLEMEKSDISGGFIVTAQDLDN